MNTTEFYTAAGDLDPFAIGRDIEQFGTDWSHKKHAADLLEKSLRPILAQLTNDQRKLDAALSRKEAEDLALGSDDYKNHLYAALDARRDANLARVKYEAAQARFEALRSLEATKRTEIQHLHRR